MEWMSPCALAAAAELTVVMTQAPITVRTAAAVCSTCSCLVGASFAVHLSAAARSRWNGRNGGVCRQPLPGAPASRCYQPQRGEPRWRLHIEAADECGSAQPAPSRRRTCRSSSSQTTAAPPIPAARGMAGRPRSRCSWATATKRRVYPRGSSRDEGGERRARVRSARCLLHGAHALLSRGSGESARLHGGRPVSGVSSWMRHAPHFRQGRCGRATGYIEPAEHEGGRHQRQQASDVTDGRALFRSR